MSGLIMPFRGKLPKIAPDAFIAPTATIIGDVAIGSGASIWFGCVLRGDVNSIRVGANTNLQDGAVVHVNSDRQGEGGMPTFIGDGVVVGHCALNCANLRWHKPPDLVAALLGEPEVAVRARRDAERLAVAREDRELGERASGRNPPDPAGVEVGEPEVSVRSQSDCSGVATDPELGDLARGGGGRRARRQGKSQTGHGRSQSQAARQQCQLSHPRSPSEIIRYGRRPCMT